MGSNDTDKNTQNSQAQPAQQTSQSTPSPTPPTPPLTLPENPSRVRLFSTDGEARKSADLDKIEALIKRKK